MTSLVPGLLPKNATQHPYWMIANTTVRNPRRVPPMVEALAEDQFAIGTGPASEDAFARWLDQTNVVQLKASTEDVSSIGRKWRSALDRLGLIYPRGHAQEFKLSGLGRRLAESGGSTRIRQVLRYSVASYRVGLKFPDEVVYLHPMSWTIAVLRSLCDLQSIDYRNDPGVTTDEFALFILHVSRDLDPVARAKEILDFRERYRAASKKTAFIKDFFYTARLGGEPNNTRRRSQLGDYPDVSMRYLASTGLLAIKGMSAQRRAGIRLASEHVAVADTVLEMFPVVTSKAGYVEHWDPADIVIGTRDGLAGQYQELLEVASTLDLSFTGPKVTGTREELELAVTSLEELILAAREKAWADAQHTRVDEIIRGLREIGLPKSSTAYEVIDADLKPSYLEWLLWRAVLALARGGVRDPAAARGFKIDEDILPIGFAPAGGADLVFEFNDFVIVLEATLMAGSRQEAAEGEPVRRHVAKALADHRKPVYAVFVAGTLDVNTVETFRLGHWYDANEQLLSLNILPVAVEQFAQWFETVANQQSPDPADVVSLVENLRAVEERNDGAVSWRDRLLLELPDGRGQYSAGRM